MDSNPDMLTDDGADPSTSEAPLREEPAAELEALDLDDDGQIDGVFFEINAVGAAAVVYDADGDFEADSALLDLDGDGKADVEVLEGTDGYLLTDLKGVHATEYIAKADLAAVAPQLVEALDLQFQPLGNGTPEQGQDLRGDQVGLDPSDSGWSVEQGELIGDPVGDAEHWFQQSRNGFCLPASVAQIVSEYTGVHFSNELPFVDLANELRLFVVGEDGVPGILFEDGVKLLNAAGVPAEYRFGDIETLASDLDAGYNIMVFIDSGEVWGQEAKEDLAADHAVVITGIDPENGTVLLSDPGIADGNLLEVPIEQFLDAWEDSENAMIVCEETPGNGSEAVEPDEETSAAAQDLTGIGGTTTPAPLEPVVSQAVQSPWIMLPVTLTSDLIADRPGNGQ